MVAWLVYNHVNLGTLFTGARRPSMLLKNLDELRDPESIKLAKLFLGFITAAELRVTPSRDGNNKLVRGAFLGPFN